MKKMAVITICAAAALFASASIDATVEAKKAPKVAKNVSKSVGKTVRNTGKTIGSAARWGGNALWVGTGVGWGHAKVTNNCTYYYNRYKQTHDAKWKNQYNACIR